MTVDEAKAMLAELQAQHESHTAAAGTHAPLNIDWGKLILIARFILDNLPVGAAPLKAEPAKVETPRAKVEPVKEDPKPKGGLGGFGKK